MAIFNKVVSTKQPTLTRRLFDGFQQMGHIKRSPDTRTTEQLLENIEYFAQRNPEVAKFKQELKSMNPKHLGLVSDICELANSHEMINTVIDMKKPVSNSKSLFEFLIEKLPKASKENPASLELSQAIIDNTDSIAAKYTIGSLSGLYDCKEAAEHMKATIPVVDFIAEGTLKGGYLMDYSKEENFVRTLNNGFISPLAHIEKIKILPDILKIADDSKAVCGINPVAFVRSDAPINKITENIKTFKQLEQQVNMEGKKIDLSTFLTKNTSLK